ncbi:MAG: PHB depolymerase family esterase [Kangiellaceae bacterium]
MKMLKNLLNVRHLSLFIVIIGLFSSAQVMAGSWQQNVSIGGFNNVHIYTPDSQSPVGDGKSLLIVLHGCVQPINNYLTAQLETAAEEYGMVVAVPDAMNKAGFSCWSYWTGSKSRTEGDYKNLIDLANTMSADSQRGIDPNQVYIAGLSSGAAFASTTACVAPDIFAGVASSAGPTIGTSSSGALNTCEVVSPNTFESRCDSYAGSFQNNFDTQLAVVAHANNDPTVDDCYNQQNANGYAKVYGDLSQLPGSSIVSDSNGKTAEQFLFENNRIAMLWFDQAVGHAWSGGQGASGGYISDQAINFASYLGQHFSENNLRVDRNQAPEFSNVTTSETNSSISVTGNATDSDGQVSNVNIQIISTSTGQLQQSVNTNVSQSNGSFSVTSQPLADDLYRIVLVATDDQNAESDVVSITQRVGPEPADTAPSLSNISATVAGQCATISGTVLDINLDLDNVVVSFSNGDVVATVSNDEYSAEQCNLPGGTNSAQVTATDAQNLSSSDSISFEIDAGVTGDYNLHISQGHITWGVGYSACYLEFGSGQFTMREYPSGSNQCQWIADGAASCAGPVQACAGGGTPPTDSDNDGVTDDVDNCPNTANSDQLDNDNDGIGNVCDPTPDGEPGGSCEEFTTFNYYHKTAGRAYSIGFFSPDYYAEGSDDPMAGSTWGSTTLSSSDGGVNWNVGSCP